MPIILEKCSQGKLLVKDPWYVLLICKNLKRAIRKDLRAGNSGMGEACYSEHQPNNHLLEGLFLDHADIISRTTDSGCNELRVSSASEMTTVWHFAREERTFFTGQALRTASLTWDSHIPHIIPLTSIVYFHMGSHPFSILQGQTALGSAKRLGNSNYRIHLVRQNCKVLPCRFHTGSVE